MADDKKKGVGGFSSKLLGMKFMQRAADKKKLEEAPATAAAAPAAPPPEEATPQATADAAWPPASTSGRCVVTYEPVPLPGLSTASGRRTFGPAARQDEGQGGDAQGGGPPPGSKAAKAAGGERSVSDAEMARTFKKPAEMRAWEPSSLRMYDLPPDEAAGAAAGAGASGGGAGEGGGKGGRERGAAGKKSGSGGSASKGDSKGASGGNSFAPLRPAKRPKV